MFNLYYNLLGDQILHFLKFLYYLLSHFEKSLIQWSRKCKINDFQSGLINSKKIPKNVKFGLQAHLNIYLTSNGSDWLLGLWKWRKRIGCIWVHKNLGAFEHSSINIYIYYMYNEEGSNAPKCTLSLKFFFSVFKVRIVNLNR